MGASSGLTLEFSNFKYKNTSSNNAVTPVTSFANIDSDTWTQVSKLMNMFANYGESDTDITNLKAWAVDSSGSSGVIQEDIGDNTLNQNGDTDKGWDTIIPENSSSGQSGKKIISAQTTSATLKHNGVTWTYKNGGVTTTGREGSSAQETINNL